MTDRIRLDDLTDDQLDRLYDERDRARRIAVALENELARAVDEQAKLCTDAADLGAAIGAQALKDRDRADQLADMLNEVLNAFTTARRDDGVILGHMLEGVIHPDDFSRWRSVLTVQGNAARAIQLARAVGARAVRAEAELAAARSLATEQAATIRHQLDHTRELEAAIARVRALHRDEYGLCTEEIKEAQNASISWAERARPAEEAITRVRSLASNMRTWCSPYGIAVDYAQRIEDTLGDVEDHTGCPYCTGGPIFPRNKLVTHIHSKHAAVMELVRQGTLDQIAELAEDRAARAEAELAAARVLAAEQADTIHRMRDQVRATEAAIARVRKVAEQWATHCIHFQTGWLLDEISAALDGRDPVARTSSGHTPDCVAERDKQRAAIARVRAQAERWRYVQDRKRAAAELLAELDRTTTKEH